MTKESQQTAASIEEARKIPEPVRLALEALKILEGEGGKVEGLNKQLPVFAMKRAQEGGEVTVETLLTHARAGELNFKRTIPEQKARSYAEIVAQLKKLPGDNEDTDPTLAAATQGNIDTLKHLLGLNPTFDINCLCRASCYGHLDVVKYLAEEHGGDVHAANELALRQAAFKGHLDVVKYLVEKHKADVQDGNEDVLRAAVVGGHLDIVKYLIKEHGADGKEHGADGRVIGFFGLREAVVEGHLDVVRFLVEEYRLDVHAGHEELLQYAAMHGRLDIVKYLVEEQRAEIHAGYCGWEQPILRMAAGLNHLDVAKYLVGQGARIEALKDEQRFCLKEYIQRCVVWQKALHIDPPKELFAKDPSYFMPKAFEAICSMLLQEGYRSNTMAFHTAGLFGTEERVLQYLEKWGEAGKQPLHDIVHDIKLPEEKTPEMNLKAWGDAVLKCGPSMAALVKFADRVPVPKKSADGKTWSMVRTREKVAQFAYKRSQENLKLSALCLENSVDEKDFDKALKLSKKIPKTKNIPEITVDGQRFDMEGGKFYRLPANDVRGLFLGELTDCCQSIGGAGAACAEHGFTSKDSGFYVVENAKGKIVAQTWAWRGEKGELVFDSLETLGQNVKFDQWRKILKEVGKELTAKKTNVPLLNIGLGGNTPECLLWDFKAAARPAVPLNYKGYRDSARQTTVWMKSGTRLRLK